MEEILRIYSNRLHRLHSWLGYISSVVGFFCCDRNGEENCVLSGLYLFVCLFCMCIFAMSVSVYACVYVYFYSL